MGAMTQSARPCVWTARPCVRIAPSATNNRRDAHRGSGGGADPRHFTLADAAQDYAQKLEIVPDVLQTSLIVDHQDAVLEIQIETGIEVPPPGAPAREARHAAA